MRVFITGATGLLGHTVARQLVDDQHQPVVLVRGETSVFEGLGVEIVRGDLLDRDTIDSAVASCDGVVHSAGLIHLGWKRLEESMSVNRDGTRTVVGACSRHDVPMIHVGTVNTLAVGTRTQVVNEETPLDHAGGQVPCSYVVSKRAGVDEVVRAANENLNAVIVHPGLMFGPWDWKPSSGRMITEVAAAWRPISPSGGTTICDNRDVATTIISALKLAINQQIPSGRQYVLGGENWTYFELWQYIAAQTSQRGPIMPAGPLQRWLLRLAGDCYSKFSKSEPDINSAALMMSSQYHWYDSSRAKTELGYRWRAPKESIRESIAWLRENGLLDH